MGHLHRQALVQRAKARDALIDSGLACADAKAAVNAFPLAAVDRELPLVPARASKKAAVRKKGKKRGTKKKG